jgi:hypothetical protein
MMNTVPNQYGRLRFALGAVLAILVFLSVMTYPALAQSPGSAATDSDEWKFTAAPYVLLPWMDGNVAVRGQEVKVDVPPSKIFDALQFAAMGYFEARKARWGAGVDAVYMALGTSVDRPSANVDLNQGAYTFIGLRQLNEKVDLVFGVRWNVLQGKLDFKEPPLQGVFEETKQWVNPIVGLKFKQRLRGPCSFAFEGDIGGFGAGSDFAWNLFPVIGIDVSKHAALKFGYRVLSEDYETGDGNRQFKYDVITQAMVFGIAFNF